MRVIRKLANKINIMSFTLDTKEKKVVPGSSSEINVDETHTINDMDFTKHLIASATTEGGVKLRIQRDINRDPFFINAGSKTVKSYKPHPTKPGVSLVQIA